MKSLIAFASTLLLELGEWCHTSTIRDVKTITERTQHEGLSFLTITLPSFCSDFERSLEQGKVTDDLFCGFRRSGGLPRFLGGFLRLVFSAESGRLLDRPNTDAIFAVRQACLVFGKMHVPCTERRTRNAISKFVECEKEMSRLDVLAFSRENVKLLRYARLMFGTVFSQMDKSIWEGTLIPKHGPGSTADKLIGNEKFNQREWPERLEKVFPFGEYIFPTWGCTEYYPSVTLLEPGAERPVKVISVPKTLKSPRIIAIEPTCMQYVQQAIMERYVELVEGNDTLRQFLGFSDQEPNQVLAREGSLSGELATLDLSEASDRVSNQLVNFITQDHSLFREGIQACRSTRAEVPGHGIITLAKFSSMGSALSFPMEETVFLLLLLVGIENALNRPLTMKDIQSLHGRVRVYGDDLIVPVDYVDSVMRTLNLYGLRVNRNKSFWTGKFRESCGKEYYDGHDVSVTRVRALFPSRRSAPEVISTSATRNQFYKAGFSSTVDYLDSVLLPVLRGNYPFVEETSPAIGRLGYGVNSNTKTDTHLQRILVKSYRVVSHPRRCEIDGVGALMKFFLKRSDLPFADKKHLTHSGRPVSVDIKSGYFPIY